MQIFEEVLFLKLQQYNRKQLNQLILCQFDARRLAGGFVQFFFFFLNPSGIMWAIEKTNLSSRGIAKKQRSV